MERRLAGTIVMVGLLTVIMMKVSVLWTFLVATALGATAAVGVLLSFVVRCVNQKAPDQIESIGTEVR